MGWKAMPMPLGHGPMFHFSPCEGWAHHFRQKQTIQSKSRHLIMALLDCTLLTLCLSFFIDLWTGETTQKVQIFSWCYLDLHHVSWQHHSTNHALQMPSQFSCLLDQKTCLSVSFRDWLSIQFRMFTTNGKHLLAYLRTLKSLLGL